MQEPKLVAGAFVHVVLLVHVGRHQNRLQEEHRHRQNLADLHHDQGP